MKKIQEILDFYDLYGYVDLDLKNNKEIYIDINEIQFIYIHYLKKNNFNKHISIHKTKVFILKTFSKKFTSQNSINKILYSCDNYYNNITFNKIKNDIFVHIFEMFDNNKYYKHKILSFVNLNIDIKYEDYDIVIIYNSNINNKLENKHLELSTQFLNKEQVLNIIELFFISKNYKMYLHSINI